MSSSILKDAIDQVADGKDLDRPQASEVLREIMEGRASEVQTAAFLIALRTKGETVDELAGLAQTMRDLSDKVSCSREDLLDTAGTGGGKTTFNVSTVAALIAAGAGAAVAKHGNRSATSKCGSADVLEALGANINLGPDAVSMCIEKVGFGFMFAPRHHAATRHVVPVRKELGVRTAFNLLGPLTNPAGASYQLVGVSDPAKLKLVAESLQALGTERALVVSSEDGLDEISASAPTHVAEVQSGKVEAYYVDPGDFGLERIDIAEVSGGTPEENAACIKEIFEGAKGSRRSLAVANAAAALYVVGRASSLKEGATLAQESIDSGAAGQTLNRYIDLTNEVG